MKQYSRVCERVDLDAIFYNFQMMKANIKDGVQMIAVIKTDGYGHGAVQIARLLEPVDYIWGYAVATLDEAVVLRKHEIKKPILVLGCIFPDQWEAMIENEVRMTTYTVEMAKGVSNLAVKMGKDAYIHIKLDTGMSRLGFQIYEDSVDAIEEISKMPGLKKECSLILQKQMKQTRHIQMFRLENTTICVMNLKSVVSHSRFTIAQIVPVSLILKKQTWIWYVPEYPFMDCILPRR